jgi:flavin reductase (DIM6/NTAB) family NADH-FMN oxidoreductase RutF
MTIDPAEAGPANVYKLMIGAIVPRPIAFVSTISLAGIRNLAPFSFFTAASANPPVICFAPMVRGSDGQQKDTLNNVRETAEFVVNIVSEDFAEKMNICSAEFPPDIDEWRNPASRHSPANASGPPALLNPDSRWSANSSTSSASASSR